MNIGKKDQLSNGCAGGDIAVVGMSVCAPGASSGASSGTSSVAQFCDNLRNQAALPEAGEHPDLISNKDNVPAATGLADHLKERIEQAEHTTAMQLVTSAEWLGTAAV